MKLATDIRLMHTGYAESVSAEKARRNLEILLAEQKRRGELPADNFYLADCYSGLGEYDKAIACARRTIASDVRFLGMTNHPYLLLIRLLILEKHPADEVDEAIAMARKRFPALPEFAMMEGMTAWQRRGIPSGGTRIAAGIGALSPMAGGATSGFLRGGSGDESSAGGV